MDFYTWNTSLVHFFDNVVKLYFLSQYLNSIKSLMKFYKTHIKFPFFSLQYLSKIHFRLNIWSHVLVFLVNPIWQSSIILFSTRNLSNLLFKTLLKPQKISRFNSKLSRIIFICIYLILYGVQRYINWISLHASAGKCKYCICHISRAKGLPVKLDVAKNKYYLYIY